MSKYVKWHDEVEILKKRKREIERNILIYEQKLKEWRKVFNPPPSPPDKKKPLA